MYVFITPNKGLSNLYYYVTIYFAVHKTLFEKARQELGQGFKADTAKCFTGNF